MARTPFVAGNWKLFMTIPEAMSLAVELKRLLSSVRGVDVAVAPTYPALYPVAQKLDGTRIAVAAQDLYFEDTGAFTGTVSGPMIKSAGCHYVLVGHSERRQLFGETDATAAKRVRAALKAELDPILCVGETLAEREAGHTLQVVERQLAGALDGVEAAAFRRITIAYEPVWAIGTGRTASSAQAQEVHAAIRSWLRKKVDTIGDEMRIQYGGSVKPENAAELMAQPDVDGALVGGASLKAEGFAAIVKAAQR